MQWLRDHFQSFIKIRSYIVLDMIIQDVCTTEDYSFVHWQCHLMETWVLAGREC